jgi:sporulation protein YlmC with PRC-barrel domain
MTKTILLGVSFIALLAAYPAFAETTKADADASAKVKIENTLNKAEQSVEKTASKAEAAVKDKYQDIKAYFSDDKDVKATASVNITEQLTSDEIIGAKVQNPQGKDIGEVEDILVNADGNAEQVIINDGGVLGLGGKQAAFDFNILEGINADKDVIVKLSEESIKAATAYDEKKRPAELYSVKKIEGAKVVDASGKAVAKVNDVAFENGQADYLIVSFDKILGMGGDEAALKFDALDFTNNKDKYTFKLNSQQTAQFENYKEAPKAN